VPDPALCSREVESVASSAPFAHVAIETSRGPHVTPVLFSTAGGHLWFAISRDTLKARVLEERPDVGVVLRSPEAVVMIRGEVRLLDPMRPTSILGSPRAVAAAPLGLQAFAMRNPRELMGFGFDALESRGGPIASGLVVAALEPRATEVFELPAKPLYGNGDSRAKDFAPRGTPAAAARLARRDGDVVVGWMAGDGPVALPAAWDSAAGIAHVSRDIARFAGVRGSAPACVAFDAADRRRPTGKRGLMLRGTGRARVREATTEVTVDAERASWFVGFETGTTYAGSSSR
jgi:hypothetical protein